MNLRITHGALLLTLVGTVAFGADIYRTRAPDGTVSYSDRPQGADSEFVYSATTRSARAAATEPSAPTATGSGAAIPPPEAPPVPTAPEGPSAADLREQRQKARAKAAADVKDWCN
jgi:hypothetical protein